MSKDLESPLLEKDPQLVIDPPKYSAEEELYIRNLRGKLESARNNRDREHEEFDGRDYVSNYELNERLANTFIFPKKNKEDTNFQSGIIRQKLFALQSAIGNLDLTGDISSFDEGGLKIQGLGDAMEDTILKTKELDNDDEKKQLRQYELLKHGTVFVEEIWDEKFKKEKTIKGKFDGQIKGVEWDTRLKKAFARPSRNIIPGINVYLGDMTKYDISEQPFVFTVDTVPYQEAKMMFGKWERWDNVPKHIKKFDPAEKTGLFNHDWRLLDTKENHVEIVRYQDKWNNEFVIILNGVLMTPVGLPLPWGYDEYNIAQQNLEPIHSKFAYGKSLVQRIRNKVALYDEMMRLAILKTQKSYMPPYINISGRVLSNRVLMPGKISHGIPPNSLVPINDKEAQGVTQAEFAMQGEIRNSIDMETTSPTFSGQQTEGQTTATEVLEMQRQAKMVLGLTVFAMSMLEWKLEWLRLKNILKNWFNEEDQVVDQARSMLQGKYRTTSVERPVEGEGMGRRIVIPSKEMPSVSSVRKAEDILTEEQGMPVRLIFLNPDEICSAKLIWQITVRPKEKRSSEVDKLMFRAFLADILPLGPDPAYIRERAATVWGENSQKLFPPVQPQPGMGEPGQGTVSPRVQLPSAEGAMNKQLKTQLGATA